MKRVAPIVNRALIAAPVLLVAAACFAGADERTGDGPDLQGAGVTADGEPIPPAPPVIGGELEPSVEAELDLVVADLRPTMDPAAVIRLGGSGDVRVAWLVVDLMRFIQHGPVGEAAIEAFERLTDTTITGPVPWRQATDWLIAWDLPAPPGYVGWKREMFVSIDPALERFFEDAGAAVDWRWVTWGGVFADDRPMANAHLPCLGCIPALVDPAVTDTTGGGWFPDDGVVFGLVVDGEARAYPLHLMEFHELVNDSIGGRRVGIPYCTLCRSAQAYLTDAVPGSDGRVELRTSGLLLRSNKMMFDLHTGSLFETFTGRAVSGPLRVAAVTLEMITVRTSTWGEWKAAHPHTTIVAEDGGIGRRYDDDPLAGRDADGPVFPVGDVDPRLLAHEIVLGVVAPDGCAWAFPAAAANTTLGAGGVVEAGGVRVTSEGGGLGAESLDGTALSSHEAFWFAWSQFHPGTALWGAAGVDRGECAG
jgi:hypothetical protein